MSNPKKKINAKQQKEIDQIITLRNTEIRNVMNGNPRIIPYVSKKGEVVGFARYLNVFLFIGFVSVVFLLHNVLSLGDTTSGMFKYLFKLFLFIVIYSVVVVFIHSLALDTSFTKNNIGRLSISLSSLIPVIVTMIILRTAPELTSPIDNTMGYYVTRRDKYFESTMYSFKSTIFPPVALRKLGENVRIPFDWLITTLDLNNIESILEKLQSKVDMNKLSLQTGIVPDFYIDLDKNSIDYTLFKNRLITLIKAKHEIGHFIVTLFACAAGVAMSLGIALTVKK